MLCCNGKQHQRQVSHQQQRYPVQTSEQLIKIGQEKIQQQTCSNYLKQIQVVKFHSHLKVYYINIRNQKQIKQLFYVPGYLRMKVKSLVAMNLESNDSQVNADLIFTVCYKGLQEYQGYMEQSKDFHNDITTQLIKRLQDQIILTFGRDDAIKLSSSQNNLQIKTFKYPKRKQLKFTVRKMFQLRFQNDILWSPFQIINLILSVTIQPIVYQPNKDQKMSNDQDHMYCIQFNLMDHKENILKLSYSNQRKFGHYQLAVSRTQAMYTNYRDIQLEQFKSYNKGKESKNLKCLLKENQKNSFQYAHFNIPYYKHPLLPLTLVFVPLWLLSVISLCIYFSGADLGTRLGAISALMIAFVALIPSIRAQIPPHPHLVFFEILVYSQILSTVLLLVESVNIRKQTNYAIIWYESGIFWVSAIILTLIVIIVLTGVILHYVKFQPSYRQQPQKKKHQFKIKQWKNQNCDKVMQEIIKSNDKINFKNQ